jgi:citrate lyase beta subunit
VPGSDERKIHKSITVGADCIVYDLEDSVSANKKGSARHMVIDALEVRRPTPLSTCVYLSLLLGFRAWKG